MSLHIVNISLWESNNERKGGEGGGGEGEGGGGDVRVQSGK
jgi:hypothetical protein